MTFEEIMESKYDELVDELSRIIAKARFGPGVTMDGRHNPRPSEIRAAKDFIDFNVIPLLVAKEI